MKHGRRLAAALGALLLILSMAGVASAAELSLSAPARPSSSILDRCADATLTVAGDAASGAVTVSDIPEECGGRPLTVWLHDNGRTHRLEAQVPGNGGAVDLQDDELNLSYSADAVVAVETWPMPTATDVREIPFVTCRTPERPEVGCSARVVTENKWGQPTTDWIRELAVTTTSREPVLWELVLNLSDSSLPMQPTNYLRDLEGGGVVRMGSSPCEVAPRTVTLQGTRGWGPHYTVEAGVSRRVTIQGSTDSGGGENLISCPGT